ncbi:hypothetical protein MASR2M78_17510 [Treponema sp.]
MKVTKETNLIVLDALQIHGKLTVHEVTKLIEVSEATARRLFVKLEEQGLVVRTFGGIRLVESDSSHYSFKDSARRMIKEKNAIGEAAAQEIENDDQVFLDSGTTVMAMSRALARRIQAEEIRGLRVVTNSLIIADQLSELCKVIFVGGEIRPERRDACGFLAEELMKKLHLKKAFLGCDALSFESGLMTTDERSARMNEIIIKNASKIYLLADAQKIGGISFVSYGTLAQLDTFFVDSSISPEQRTQLEKRIPHLIVVNPA